MEPNADPRCEAVLPTMLPSRAECPPRCPPHRPRSRKRRRTRRPCGAPPPRDVGDGGTQLPVVPVQQLVPGVVPDQLEKVGGGEMSVNMKVRLTTRRDPAVAGTASAPRAPPPAEARRRAQPSEHRASRQQVAHGGCLIAFRPERPGEQHPRAGALERQVSLLPCRTRGPTRGRPRRAYPRPRGPLPGPLRRPPRRSGTRTRSRLLSVPSSRPARSPDRLVPPQFRPGQGAARRVLAGPVSRQDRHARPALG